MNIPGDSLVGVEHGLDFLMMVNEKGRQKIGSNIVVIGGGYTAMDCARTAIRLGASTAVSYRRGLEDMVVLPGEVQELLNEGGHMDYFKAPKMFFGAGSIRQSSFLATSVRLENGKKRIYADESSISQIDIDGVILATGQQPDMRWI